MCLRLRSALLVVAFFQLLEFSSKPSKQSLTLVQCNQLRNIKYDARNNFDFFSAARQQNANNNNNNNRKQPIKVATNLKSILPAQLSAPNPYAGGGGVAEAGADSSLPQLANTLAVVRGNGPRGRAAKQLGGFEEATGATKLASEEGVAQPAAAANKESAQLNDVCLTPGCVKAAAEILKNIDERVNPCEDFYQYACGNWIEAQVIPEDKTSVSLFSVVQDELDNKLRNLIESAPTAKDPPIVGKMRNLYESCMNTSECQQGAGRRKNSVTFFPLQITRKVN